MSDKTRSDDQACRAVLAIPGRACEMLFRIGRVVGDRDPDTWVLYQDVFRPMWDGKEHKGRVHVLRVLHLERRGLVEYHEARVRLTRSGWFAYTFLKHAHVLTTTNEHRFFSNEEET